MKGQASLEYISLSLISLALICVSVMALSAIKADSERSFRIIMLESSAQSLADAMDEACAMGYGNMRSITLTVPVSLESRRIDPGAGSARAGTGWIARFSYGGSSTVKPMLCGAQDIDLPRGEVSVKNEEGMIVFKGS